jgi:predicted flap endonuclease-1-like 5' DNA nuclease
METLASRLAERNRLRELRAARLARLRPDDGALEEFLRALAGTPQPVQPARPARAGDVLSFPEQRAERSDLDRLPGAGPGLIWALGQAGITRLADLAPLEPAELAARLGPIGRLVPAQAWIDAARDA